MPNYALGKIYKLTSEQTDRVYIGFTCKKYLSQRKRDHKSKHNVWMNDMPSCKANLASFDLIKYDELLVREKYWIKQYREKAVNKYRPIRTEEEQLQQSKEYRSTLPQ